jgi:predicted aconitase
MASSGSVALFHWVGVTPEAETIQDAFNGKHPEKIIDVSLGDLVRARNDLSSSTSDRLDMIVLGSPHFSLNELRSLGPLIEGKRRHPGVRFLVTTGRGVKLLAEEMDLLVPLMKFGAEITVDTCILTTPMLPSGIRSIMTNSAKYAYYTPGILDREVVFGSTQACVESAVSGKVVKDDRLWVV